MLHPPPARTLKGKFHRTGMTTYRELYNSPFRILRIYPGSSIEESISSRCKATGLRFYFLIRQTEFVLRITVVCLETSIRLKVFYSLPQHWLILEESRFHFMVLILTNCSVQLKSRRTVSLPLQFSAGYQVLHAINSQSDSMKGRSLLCAPGILCYYGNGNIYYPAQDT